MKKCILGLMGFVCLTSQAQNNTYTAFVLTTNPANNKKQILFINDEATKKFTGFEGKVLLKDDPSVFETDAKAKITQFYTPGTVNRFETEQLIPVLRQYDSNKKHLTLFFYSPTMVNGDVNKSSWMEINELKKKRLIDYGEPSKEYGAPKNRPNSSPLPDELSTLFFEQNPETKISLMDAIIKAIETDIIPQSPWPTRGAILFDKRGDHTYVEFTTTYTDPQNPLVVPDITGQDLKTKEYAEWPSLEHYFQSQKFEAPVAFFDTSIKDKPADKLQELMHSYQSLQKNIPAWENGGGVRALLTGVRAKFSQDDALKKLLLGTGNTLLINDSGKDWINDMTWGAGMSYRGFNFLGQILMHVRNELKTGQALVFQPVHGFKNYKGVATTPDFTAPQWYRDRLSSVKGKRSLQDLAGALDALQAEIVGVL